MVKRPQKPCRRGKIMGGMMIKSLFTWWNRQTLNTRFYTWRKGVLVGDDAQGNVFYQTRDGKRRWVIFAGECEASRVGADWHGWLHHTLPSHRQNARCPSRIGKNRIKKIRAERRVRIIQTARCVRVRVRLRLGMRLGRLTRNKLIIERKPPCLTPFPKQRLARLSSP